MFPLKLLGVALAGGAALGVWASAAIKEKLGGGSNMKKVKKGNVDFVIIPENLDVSQGIKIMGHEKKTESDDE